ncbi:hypothetical protein Egran_04547 [Elaphomyces granulatus]|uniref:Rhodopsin domain-containing protein n=1 Tax=Elaphomyces granulatus TaxID=519963 RepID=A0A232LV30_9EURO|nr:hypothetical protein Egran_04547 [Elaphomyces granulatus]
MGMARSGDGGCSPLRLKFEDGLMVLVLIFYTLLTVFLQEVAKYGTNEIPPSQFDSIDPATVPNLIYGSKLVIVVEQFWLATIWGCKACLLLLYSAITTGLREHTAVMIISAFCALGYITIEVLFFSFWCHPFYDYWSVPPANLQCSVYRNHLILVLALNVSSDIMMMGILLPLLIRARLSLVKKLSLCALFSLGIFVVICSILSKVYSIYTPYGSEWVVWYVREAGTAVVVANIPQTWSLMRRVFNLRSFLSNGTSNISQTAPYRKGSVLRLSHMGTDKLRPRSRANRSESEERISHTDRLEIWEHKHIHITEETAPSSQISQPEPSLKLDLSTLSK